MRFDVETSQDYRSFDGVGIGAIFLDDNGYPCIKIPDVRSCYDLIFITALDCPMETEPFPV